MIDLAASFDRSGENLGQAAIGSAGADLDRLRLAVGAEHIDAAGHAGAAIARGRGEALADLAEFRLLRGRQDRAHLLDELAPGLGEALAAGGRVGLAEHGAGGAAALGQDRVELLALLGGEAELVSKRRDEFLRRALCRAGGGALRIGLVGRKRGGRGRHRRFGRRRPPAQRGVRHAQHIGVVLRFDAQVRGHAGLQFEPRILHRNDGGVDDDVLHGLRAETHLLHAALEGAAGIGVDREGNALAVDHTTDIGFVDVGGNLHVAQIVGDQKQGGRLQARGDRLAELDIALDHHAVDRRADIGVLEIDLDLPHHRFALSDLGDDGHELRLGDALVGGERLLLRLGTGERRLRLRERRALGVALGAGSVERGCGGVAARLQFDLASQDSFGVGRKGFGAGDLRNGVGLDRLGAQDLGTRALDLRLGDQLLRANLLQIGARGVELGADLVGVEPGDELVGLHFSIIVGKNLDDLAGDLRTHDHGRDRVDGAGGIDGGDDRAAIDLGQAVRRLGGARRKVREVAGAEQRRQRKSQKREQANHGLRRPSAGKPRIASD